MPQGHTPLKPDDDEKGVIFRDGDYDQLHALRIRTGAKSYKDAAMHAIRNTNAILQNQQVGTGHVDELVSPFLDQAMHIAARNDHAHVRDLLGLVNTLVVYMADDEDNGNSRLDRARSKGLTDAIRQDTVGQTTLEQATPEGDDA